MGEPIKTITDESLKYSPLTYGFGTSIPAIYGRLKSKTILPISTNLSLDNKIKPIEEFPRKKFDFSSLVGNQYINNLAGYASSLIGTNRIKTSIPTNLVTNAPFIYSNRSNYLINRNNSSFKTLLNTRLGNPVNTGQALGATLDANNRVALAEAERQDNAIKDYNNRQMQINATNIDALNRSSMYKTMLDNSKIAQKVNATTSFLEGIDTITAQKNQQVMDEKAMKYSLAAASLGRGNAIIEVLKKLLN